MRTLRCTVEAREEALSPSRLERVSNIDDFDSRAPLRPDFTALTEVAGMPRTIFETRSRHISGIGANTANHEPSAARGKKTTPATTRAISSPRAFHD